MELRDQELVAVEKRFAEEKPLPEGHRWLAKRHQKGWAQVQAVDEDGRPYIGARTFVRGDGAEVVLSSNPGIHPFDVVDAVLAESGASATPAEIKVEIERRARDRRPV